MPDESAAHDSGHAPPDTRKKPRLLDDAPIPVSEPEPERTRFTLTRTKVEAINRRDLPPIDVHDFLATNLAKDPANARPALTPPVYRFRRRRDYILAMAVVNLFFGGVAVAFRGNPMILASGLAGMVLGSAGLTYIIWFVMSKY